eukprot:gene10025-biopygen1725
MLPQKPCIRTSPAAGSTPAWPTDGVTVHVLRRALGAAAAAVCRIHATRFTGTGHGGMQGKGKSHTSLQQMHCDPVLAGADRTQKMVIWPQKKTIFNCVEVQMYAPQRPGPGFNGIWQLFPCAACPCPVSPARYGSPRVHFGRRVLPVDRRRPRAAQLAGQQERLAWRQQEPQAVHSGRRLWAARVGGWADG